ncbi:MAG: sigma-54 dependent transcriptional regulator, partial [Mariniblastus sp.]|nr:sigma-54 dependent transcriptional regulator [Mariniblastus sp.]
ADQACAILGITNSSEAAENPFDFPIGPSNSVLSADFDVVLTDVKMPGMSGLEFCQQVKKWHPNLPVIVMTAYGSLETAVEALRAGAFDFATKPIELELLKACLIRAAETSQLRRRVRNLELQTSSGEFGGLIGQSDELLRLKSQLNRILNSSAPVLLSGESGSGKEVVARELHDQSERATQPFVAVNCAALPESLFESELFGHVKGAFTDAKEDREGLFVQADGGTLFLDEIGEMPIELQPKLLRALEQKTIRPIGGKTEVPFDVHLIAATNRDLETAIEQKKFRADLYYRINVLEINIPPLRNRGTDVLILAKHFLKMFASDRTIQIDEPALQQLLNYDWPGNVRELRNVIERAVVLAREDEITVDLLTDRIVNFRPSKLVIGHRDNQPLESLETIQHRYIRYVLEQTHGNKSEAAKVLGLDRKTLYRKLKEQQNDDDTEA